MSSTIIISILLIINLAQMGSLQNEHIRVCRWLKYQRPGAHHLNRELRQKSDVLKHLRSHKAVDIAIGSVALLVALYLQASL